MIVYVFHFVHIFKVLHFVFNVLFCLTFLTREIFFQFSSRKYTFFDCKQYVGAGFNILLSVFDGLGPSIFCRMIEKARPMREEMDGKVVYFPPESAFLTLMLYFKKYFSLFVPWLGV